MTLEAVPVKPEEAIAFFRAKGFKLEQSFSWTDVWQEQHAAMFTVAKTTGYDVLGDIHAAVEKAIADGQSFETFRKELTPKLREKGWWGDIEVADPAGGTKEVHVGPRRLRTIFQTNIRMAYSAGQWQRVQRLKKARPYLRYLTVNDDRVRRQHRAWHDVVLKVDDPWWDTHWPPNGWGCRCIVQQLSARDLGKLKLKAAEKGPEGLPRRFLNRRTGAVEEVPEGISPGFAYNPGKVSAAANSGRQLMQRLAALPPDLQAAAWAAAARFAVAGVTADFASFVGKALAPGFTAVGDLRIIGAFTPSLLRKLDDLGVKPETSTIIIGDKQILHMLRNSKEERGEAISEGQLLMLPLTLQNPMAVLRDLNDPGVLLYVFDTPGAGAAGKIVLRLNYRARLPRRFDGSRPKVTVNEIVTAQRLPLDALRNSGSYEVLEGSL